MASAPPGSGWLWADARGAEDRFQGRGARSANDQREEIDADGCGTFQNANEEHPRRANQSWVARNHGLNVSVSSFEQPFGAWRNRCSRGVLPWGIS
eukprot:11212301-Lingulodinium_polyedra.AAC.1